MTTRLKTAVEHYLKTLRVGVHQLAAEGSRSQSFRATADQHEAALRELKAAFEEEPDVVIEVDQDDLRLAIKELTNWHCAQAIRMPDVKAINPNSLEMKSLTKVNELIERLKLSLK